MSPKSSSAKKPAEQDGLRGAASIAKLCRKEGIAQSLYYTWSKEFMEASKRRLGDTVRAPPPPTRSRIYAARLAP